MSGGTASQTAGLKPSDKPGSTQRSAHQSEHRPSDRYSRSQPPSARLVSLAALLGNNPPAIQVAQIAWFPWLDCGRAGRPGGRGGGEMATGKPCTPRSRAQRVAPRELGSGLAPLQPLTGGGGCSLGPAVSTSFESILRTRKSLGT